MPEKFICGYCGHQGAKPKDKKCPNCQNDIPEKDPFDDEDTQEFVQPGKD